MTPEDRLKDLLTQVWFAALDCDPGTWHQSPFAHIVFLIGERMDEVDPSALGLARYKATRG